RDGRRERQEVLQRQRAPFGRVAAGDPDGEPDENPGDDGAPEATDASEHDDQERRNDGIDADVRPAAPDRREHDAGGPRERRAEAEHEEAEAPDVDAERPYHLAVVR